MKAHLERARKSNSFFLVVVVYFCHVWNADCSFFLDLHLASDIGQLTSSSERKLPKCPC